MIWRTASGQYLRQLHVQALADSRGQPIRGDSGLVLSACASFVLTTPDGAILTRYDGPLTYTLDDEWGMCSIYWVTGSTLFEYHWIENAWTRTNRLLETAVLSGLTPR